MTKPSRLGSRPLWHLRLPGITGEAYDVSRPDPDGLPALDARRRAYRVQRAMRTLRRDQLLTAMRTR